ncbi:MAG: MlaE family lipid ABC transporter permease subunit [Desulfuromonadales bacterium]|nr:MlaE family lipid ABC transporter permease subunit [Desulfuromonadales bacterium]
MATPRFTLQTSEAEGQALVINLVGRLDMETTPAAWREAVRLVEVRQPPRLIVEAAQVEYCDGAGIGLLVELCCRQEGAGRQYEIRGLRPQFRQLFDLFDPADIPPLPPERQIHVHLAEEVGRASWRAWQELYSLVAFLGHLVVALAATFRHPRQRLRGGEILLAAEKAGVNALPIVLLVSFLIGLIMAFQSAIPMRRFGAEIYVANLVGLSMLRELGPLMTAMVLAGRSGSAFAAELGTMKVNEEIDALVTMGIDPVRFLVVNRFLAAVLVMPLLTVFADLVAIMGGSVVLLSLGYSLTTYFNQLLSAITWVDFTSGLFKALFFGGIVAWVGCLSGLQTRLGPSAVGDSATRAVVAGNVLIIVADGIFAVLFYFLGI